MKSSRRTWAGAGMCLLALAVVSIGADWAAPVGKSVGAAPSYPRRVFSERSVWDVVSVLGPERILIRQGQKQQTVKLIGVAGAEVGAGEAVGGGYESRAVEFLGNLLGGEQVYVLRGRQGSSGAGELRAVKVFRVPDGLYVNLELVRQGYRPLAERGLGKERKLFEFYQRRARQAGKGLWSKLLPATPATTVPGVTTVYITKSGKKYHRGTCQFLAKSKIPISLSQAKKRGFTACKVCKPGRE
ncbi:MAG: thermonuclease family protein [Phycisphaerae bacterium]|nr:thermonuclease family protein [Phycisphaerae bacterium]